MASYTKPWLTYDDQLALLESRGFTIKDRQHALIALKSMGYYRLNGYWYPFRIRENGHREGLDIPRNDVHPGTVFDDIVEICNFDRKLRVAIWEAIERVENALRVAIAYQIGQYGPFAYLDKHTLSSGAGHPSQHDPNVTFFEEFCAKMHASLQTSREDFVQHFRKNYDGRLPIWAAVEIWDFGMLSRFYQLIKPEDKLAISTTFGITNARTISSWLQALNILRNYCAHHGRLNRRMFAIAPGFPKIDPFRHLRVRSDQEKHRLYPQLAILAYLLRAIAPESSWRTTIIDLFREPRKPANINLNEYGIPEDWLQQTIWTH
ncbi:MAG: Abi family protein [Thermomicrobiales bacterium]